MFWAFDFLTNGVKGENILGNLLNFKPGPLDKGDTGVKAVANKKKLAEGHGFEVVILLRCSFIFFPYITGAASTRG